MAEGPGSLLTWMMGMVEGWPKNLTCCQERGFGLHVAPDDFCHLPLVSCTSRCLAPHASRGSHQCLPGVLQSLGSVAQGKELGDAAVARAG